MFLLIVTILGVLTIAFWTVIDKYNLEILGVLTLISSGFFIITSLITYPVSLDTIAGIEAFYDNNQTVYKQAVEKFPESGRIVTREDTTTVYLLSYDMTKSIMGYNTNLTWYNRYQEHWFLGGFVAKIPNNLDYISIN